MSGVSDTWMMPATRSIDCHFVHKTAKEEKSNHMNVIFMLMRTLRLLRIVRLFRLVRIVRPLFELAMGVMQALQHMFLVLVVMIMTLYATASPCTRIIGHGTLISDEDAENDQELANVGSMFGSVEQSIFSLFGTVSNLCLFKLALLFEEVPVLQQKEEVRRARISEHVIEDSRQADSDGNGTVTREEFNAMLAMPDLEGKLQMNSYLRLSGMQELFESADYDMSGATTINEFMKGFKCMNVRLRARSLVNVQDTFTLDLMEMETSRLRCEAR